LKEDSREGGVIGGHYGGWKRTPPYCRKKITNKRMKLLNAPQGVGRTPGE